MSEEDRPAGEWRTLIVVAITLAYPLAQTGFQLGAHGELKFQQQLIAWTAVTATLVTFSFVPKRILPFPRWHIWILFLPSVWMLARLYIGLDKAEMLNPVLFVVGIASFAFCFPYAIYLVVLTANPGLPNLRGLVQWLVMALCAGALGLGGFLIGGWSEQFISCQEARIEGQKLPEHCKAK